MTRLPRVSGKDVVAALIRGGYRPSHVRGSHHYLRHPDKPKLVLVPVHGNKILPAGTLRSVLNLAELTPDEFQALL